MSLSFNVAVPAENWPSFAEMNALIAARGYPLRVVPPETKSPDDPMGEADGLLSLIVEFRGKTQEMDAYHRVMEAFDADDTNEMLEQIGAPHRVTPGMHDWSYSFGPSIPPEYLAPYCILAGILVLDCDGYGYEGQGPSFGAEDYGRAELAEADRQIALLDAPAPIAPPKTRPAPQPKRKLFGIVPVNIWTLLAGLVVVLMLAECVDQNIYNFTGTGPLADP
jgi:hypothetical protein